MKIKNKEEEAEVVDLDAASGSAKVKEPATAQVQGGKAPAAAKLKTKPQDFVGFVPLADIETPPRIGNFNFRKQLKVTKLVKGHTYNIPRIAAQLLSESNYGFIKE